MTGTRERKKRTDDTTTSVKSHDTSSKLSSNLPGPCTINFFQRNLGNNYIQSTVGEGTAPLLQMQELAHPPEAETAKPVTYCQPTLRMGTPGDSYEKEADNVMRNVLTASGNHLPKAFAITTPPSIASSGSTSEVGYVSPDVERRIKRQRGGGHPIETRTRRGMEAVFGYDFRSVRIHNNDESRRTADEIGARAFTVRNGIWLGSNESSTDAGLMAHELTHVIQQGAAKKLDRKTAIAPDRDPVLEHLQSLRDRKTAPSDEYDLGLCEFTSVYGEEKLERLQAMLNEPGVIAINERTPATRVQRYPTDDSPTCGTGPHSDSERRRGCWVRQNFSWPWRFQEDVTFNECEQANNEVDSDDVREYCGLVWWNERR